MPIRDHAQACCLPLTCRRPRLRAGGSARTSQEPANLAACNDPRRHGTLAALFRPLEAVALDMGGHRVSSTAGKPDIFALADEHTEIQCARWRDLDAAASLRESGQLVVDNEYSALPAVAAGCAVPVIFSRADSKPHRHIAAWSAHPTTVDIRNCARIGGACARCSLPSAADHARDATPPSSRLARRDYLAGRVELDQNPHDRRSNRIYWSLLKRHALDDAGRVPDKRCLRLRRTRSLRQG